MARTAAESEVVSVPVSGPSTRLIAVVLLLVAVVPMASAQTTGTAAPGTAAAKPAPTTGPDAQRTPPAPPTATTPATGRANGTATVPEAQVAEPPPVTYLPPHGLAPVREHVDAGRLFTSLARFGAAVFSRQPAGTQVQAADRQVGASTDTLAPPPGPWGPAPGGVPQGLPGSAPGRYWAPTGPTPTGPTPTYPAPAGPTPAPATPQPGPYATTATAPTAAGTAGVATDGMGGAATGGTWGGQTAPAGSAARFPVTAGPTYAPPGTPIFGGPVPPNYILGGGDMLELRVWSRNREQVSTTVTVSPEGFVFLPTAGKLSVAGQTVQQAHDLVATAYARIYDRPEVTLLVATQRAVDVYVLGDVSQPGKYTLSGMATVFSALYAACGPSESGSYRQVRLERLGEKPQLIDLYDYLLRGERRGDVLLQNGDMLFVTPAKLEIGVAGEVRRPARYELTEPITLADALEMAGGIGPQGYAPAIEVWRTGDHRGWQLVNLDATDKTRLSVQDGDLIVVKPLLPITQQTVTIRGAVNRPDSYAFSPGLTVSGLLKLAEGPADGANLRQALLWRLDSDMAYNVERVSLTDALTGKAGADTPLQPRDVVYLMYQEEAMVTVQGEVLRPGSYPFGQGMRVRDLISLAGGLTPQAFAKRASLMRWLDATQELTVVAVDLQAALAGNDQANTALQRLDVLEVKARDVAVTAAKVHIDGCVQKPGSYPYYPGMKVSDLIYAAGCPLPQASSIEYVRGRTTESIEPQRLTLTGPPEAFRVEPDLALEPDVRVSVQGHGRFVSTPSVVLVRGQVTTQGAYALLHQQSDEGDTVWSVLQRAGGPLPDADPSGIVVYRGLGEIFSQTRELGQMMRNYNRETVAAAEQLENAAAAIEQAMSKQVNTQLAQIFSSDAAVSVVIPPRTLQVEQSLQAIPIDGKRLLESGGKEGDVQLSTGDVIMVPRRRDTVAVVGAVVRPGAVPYEAKLRIGDYVARAGGFANDAADKRLLVLAPNGSVRPTTKKTLVQPGDVILVPSQYIVQTRRTQSTWESVLRGLATAAALALTF